MHEKKIRDTVYYYTSVRENGRVKTIYLGRSKEEAIKKERELKNAGKINFVNNINKRFFVYIFLVIIIAAGLFFFRGVLVGYVTLGGPEVYLPGETITGEINLTFLSEELYPEGSEVEVSIGGQVVLMGLSEFLSQAGGEIDSGAGEYYVSGSVLTGYGNGFGITGEKTVYPQVSFSYNLYIFDNETNETRILNGSCNFENPYVVNIEDLTNQTNVSYGVSLVSGSVSVLNKTINDSFVVIRIENDSVIATTDYYESIQGLGRGFVSDEERDFSLGLERLNLTAPGEAGEYVLTARVVYNQTILEESSKNVTVSVPLVPTPPPPVINDTDGDGDPDTTDCDPQNPQIHHGANEICDDGVDNNCDGLTDKEEPICMCEDSDNDGYDICHPDIDCDDTNPNINPGAKEICGNMIDEDCDGFDLSCVATLSDFIESNNIKYVKKEVENEILKKNRARVIIKLRDESKKSDVLRDISPESEVKNFISAVFNEQEMIILLNRFTEDDIELIQIDHPVRLFLDGVVNQTGVSQFWDSNVTGKGQTVCVIDSGIDYNHPNLSSNYIGGYDFVDEDNDPLDDYGHGTYVSGVIAGIAPDSKILAAKVFGSSGVGYESDILAGIDYCVGNKDLYNISVMLMSFGGGIYNTSCYCDSNLVANESNFAVSQGIFAVAACGNVGGAYLKAPACGSNVTSVGAVDRWDNIADFTNIEPLLDILALGVEVKSTKMGGGLETKNGTSISAAVVAGGASLLLENESLEPLALQYRLRSTGFVVAHNGTDYPRLDAYSALTNQITNTPSDQQGTQCEGTWEEYEPLAGQCSEFAGGGCDPGSNCWCSGCETSGTYTTSCEECLCTTNCVKGSCGAGCAVHADCTDFCDGSIRDYWWSDQRCNTACTSCSCYEYQQLDVDASEARCHNCQVTDCVGPTTTCWMGSYCCGDDSTPSEERYRKCETHANIAWSCGGADGCCTSNLHCVDTGGTCYSQGGRNPAGNGNDLYGAWCNSHIWYDCDDYISNCGASYCGTSSGVIFGEATGEASKGQTECCGDDSNENYQLCTTSGSPESFSCSGNYNLCCSSTNDCPDDGTCYAENTCRNDARCSAGTWYDQDTGSARCTGCGNDWGIGFDSGTYSSCCEDDSGDEYTRYCSYVAPDSGFPDSGDCTSGDDMCCNPSTDCVNTDGTACIASGTHATDGDGDDDHDYCINNKWWDCYNDDDCPTGWECDGTPGDCDNTLSGGSGTTCDASNPCLYIEDSGSVVKARFDDNGYVDVKGGLYESQAGPLSCSNCFQVKVGATVALYIDSSGNLYTLGTFNTQTTPTPAGNNDFQVKDSGGTVVGYIDGATGNMYFKGTLHYNSNF